MKTTKDRLLDFLSFLKIGQNAFEKKCGISNAYISNCKGTIGSSTIAKISHIYPELNIDWLISGKGNMLKHAPFERSEIEAEETLEAQIGGNDEDIIIYDIKNAPTKKKLIPLYDDVSTIGGNLPAGYSAKMTPDTQASEWIDPGSWFKSATHAIRHYEDSMAEYPSGCILALKIVEDKQLVVWGKNYVISTSEYRITKRVQRGKNDHYIRAYSSNIETYPDGQLIHEPIDIAWGDIVDIYLVLGCVIKSGNGTVVLTTTINN